MEAVSSVPQRAGRDLEELRVELLDPLQVAQVLPVDLHPPRDPHAARLELEDELPGGLPGLELEVDEGFVCRLDRRVLLPLGFLGVAEVEELVGDGNGVAVRAEKEGCRQEDLGESRDHGVTLRVRVEFGTAAPPEGPCWLETRPPPETFT